MLEDIRKLKKLYQAKHDHFLGVDFEFYKKWKLIIKIIIWLNPRYISCTIYRKKYKIHNNLVIIGLKWNGNNVNRRTNGFAKDFLKKNKNPKCIYCGCKLTQENATSDHIIPISNGGNNTQINLVVVCKKCNENRGNIPFFEFLRLKNPKFRGIKYPWI